ncbi:MAG: Eco57I restriction-modification methylase domain-containing protein [Candidatus Hodarchaeales archaeon]|jgi:hypothetical protein
MSSNLTNSLPHLFENLDSIRLQFFKKLTESIKINEYLSDNLESYNFSMMPEFIQRRVYRDIYSYIIDSIVFFYLTENVTSTNQNYSKKVSLIHRFDPNIFLSIKPPLSQLQIPSKNHFYRSDQIIHLLLNKSSHNDEIFSLLLEEGLISWLKSQLDKIDGLRKKIPASIVHWYYEYSRNKEYVISTESSANRPNITWYNSHKRKHSGIFFTRTELCDCQLKSILHPYVKSNIIVPLQTSLHDYLLDKKTGLSFDNVISPLQRFFRLKVLDPSMGVGNYLFIAYEYLSYIADRILNIIFPLFESHQEEWYQLSSKTPIPNFIEISQIDEKSRLLFCQNLISQYITRNMLYGVDIDCKAVKIAQYLLSRSIIKENQKKSGPKLDLNIRSGNSLISPLPITQEGNSFLITNFSSELLAILAQRREINFCENEEELAELFASLQKLRKNLYYGVYRLIKSPSQNINIPESLKKIFRHFNKFKRPDLIPINPFIWQIEFPELFFEYSNGLSIVRNPGFNLVIGNPPWEKSKLELHEWVKDWGYTLNKQEEGKKIAKELWIKNGLLEEDWKERKGLYKRLNHFYKLYYPHRGGGDFNLYKLFIECFFRLTKNKGFLSILVPTSFLTDYYGRDLRKLLLNHTQIKTIIEISAGTDFFPDVMKGFSSSIIQAQRLSKTTKIVIIPRIKTIQDLDKIKQSKPVNTSAQIAYSRDFILKFSPKLMIFPLCQNQKFIALLMKLQSFQRLGKGGWNCFISRGFDRTIDKEKRFSSSIESSIPMLEGVHINRFGFTLKKIDFYAIKGMEKTHPAWNKKAIAWQISPGRNVMRRRLHFARLPENVVTSNKLGVITNFPEESWLYLITILNSIPTEFRLRQVSLGADIANFMIEEIPIPIFDPLNPLHQLITKWAKSFEPKAKEWADRRIEVSTKVRAKIEQEYTRDLVHGDALSALAYDLTYKEFILTFEAHPKVWLEYKEQALAWYLIYKKKLN